MQANFCDVSVQVTARGSARSNEIVTEEEKDFDLESDLGILETISNIVRADEEMITFELMTLVRNSQSQIIILQTK